MPEKKIDISKAVADIIMAIGEDLNRPGLIDTPNRVARAWKELARGYNDFPDPIKIFPSHFSGMVLRLGIPFSSTCEHHMLPYFGTIDFSYIPNGKVIGISKIIRLFRHYASRLTIQEDLTEDLISRFCKVVQPKGCAIRLSAFHGCESARGITQHGVPTITLSFSGVFAEDIQLQNQFLLMLKSG